MSDTRPPSLPPTLSSGTMTSHCWGATVDSGGDVGTW